MDVGEKIRRWQKAISRKVLGPSVTDRDRPDPRPPNPARDRIRAAEITAALKDKEGALGAIKMHTALSWSDYDYQQSFHQRIITEATKKASDFGASEEEIRTAISEGNLSGATMRQGFDDYHL